MSVRRCTLLVLSMGVLLAGPLGLLPVRLLTAQQAPLGAFTGAQYLADFDSLWSLLLGEYAYRGEAAGDWAAVRSVYRPRAERAANLDEFVRVLEQTLEALYDPHTRLKVHTLESPRHPPYDIWAEWREGRAIVTQVRPGSAADRAGAEPGMEVLGFNGTAIEEAVARRAPPGSSLPSAVARDWALRALLAGAPGSGRTLEVRDPRRKLSTLRLDDSPEESTEALPPPPEVVWKTLPEGFGYVAIHDLSSLNAVSQFDRALEVLRSTPGLVVDIRAAPAGGDPAVVRGLLGRLIAGETAYSRRSVPGNQLWPDLDRRSIELVQPRGEWTYTAPVVVLVGRWTAGAAEDIALALDAMQRATVVGTPMAGLHGAVRKVRLPNTGVPLELAVERVYHLDGTPREEFVPPVLVDLSTEAARRAEDAVLAAGLEVLRDLVGPAS